MLSAEVLSCFPHRGARASYCSGFFVVTPELTSLSLIPWWFSDDGNLGSLTQQVQTTAYRITTCSITAWGAALCVAFLSPRFAKPAVGSYLLIAALTALDIMTGVYLEGVRSS